MKEKTSTDLYKDLNEVIQKETEDAQSFVLRAMELREKILMAPEMEGSVQFDKAQVQSMFLHTIRTGLRDADVRTKLDRVLKQGIEDEKLIEEINTASIEESVRQKKRGAVTKKSVSIAQADVTSSAISEALAPLLGTVKQLNEEVKSLRSEVAEMKRGTSGAPTPQSYPRGCPYCRREGRADSCRHCWRCGAGDHTANNCRRQPP
jgi:hypothetical protein